MKMSQHRRFALATLLLAGLAIAPAPPPPAQKAAKPSPLAEARYQAAVKQYQITWSYYQQSRIDTFQVYFWSKLVLESRREMADKPADRIIALEDHLARMKQFEDLVLKVRRLGFGRSYDVGSVAYYRLEAEHWLELARANAKGN